MSRAILIVRYLSVGAAGCGNPLTVAADTSLNHKLSAGWGPSPCRRFFACALPMGR